MDLRILSTAKAVLFLCFKLKKIKDVFSDDPAH